MAALHTRLLGNDRRGYTAAYRVFIQTDEETGDALGRIRCPVLAMTGALDTGSTPEMGQRMAADLARCRQVVLPGLAHGAPFEGAPQVNRELLKFLREA